MSEAEFGGRWCTYALNELGVDTLLRRDAECTVPCGVLCKLETLCKQQERLNITHTWATSLFRYKYRCIYYTTHRLTSVFIRE